MSRERKRAISEFPDSLYRNDARGAEIADQLVSIFARADLCHCCLPPGTTSVQSMILLATSISYLRKQA